MRENEFEDRPELIAKRARTIIVERVFLTTLAVCVLLALGLLSYNALNSLATRDAILDCTQPTGECYKEGQRRTGEVIRQLIESNQDTAMITRQIVVLAAACADDPGNNSADEIERCVDRQLGTPGNGGDNE